jgi:hypothetical protein
MDFSRFNLLARYRKFRKELRENWAYYQVKADKMAAEKAANKASHANRMNGFVTFDEAYEGAFAGDFRGIGKHFEQKRAERAAHTETSRAATDHVVSDINYDDLITKYENWWYPGNVFHDDPHRNEVWDEDHRHAWDSH